MTIEQTLRTLIRDIIDFPTQGVVFKDITPIMLDPIASNMVLDYLEQLYKNKSIDAIAGVESRGFLFGFSLAMRLNVPFVLIRKKGKLPYKKVSHDYKLEYGFSTIEMHTDAIKAGQKVLIHDDLLATGGSAQAATQLIKKCGGEIAGINFLVELKFLNGRDKLTEYADRITTIIDY